MSGLALALTGAASLAALTAARPGPLDPAPSTRTFATAVEAVQAALAGSAGGVVAFGELHQTRDTAGIPSALKRFETDILPAVADRLSHLVVETWVTTGRCGEAEKAVTADVERTTQRPASTESEIETLIRVARERGIAPRILSISCADYEAMRPAGGQVDYDRTLRVTARALEGAIVRSVAEAGGRAVGAPSSVPSSEGPRMVAVYGGALHNDLVPDPELAAYSFAPRVLAATLGRFLEIDLVVPEYVAGSAGTQAQPWWRAYRRARPGRRTAVLIRRSARSYVVVFPFHVAAGARGESPRERGR